VKKTERNYGELDLASIVGAKENLRETAPCLSEQGYGVFQGTERQPESLQAMALSGDAARQAAFVTLIDRYESQTKELADNMATAGQLEPIRVRPADEKGKYDLVFGARRTLARLYIHAKSGGKIPARLTAEVVDQDGKDALYASISENIRVEPSPIDEARSYERLRKTFGMSAKEIGEAMGKGEKVVRTRLRLLKLPKELRQKVHLGKIGVERALKHLDQSGEQPSDKPGRKAPSLKQLQQYYSSAPDDLPDDIRPLITEEARKLLAHWLGVQYAPRQ
jgi:ParB/RepB/Spo0J family partition protein